MPDEYSKASDVVPAESSVGYSVPKISNGMIANKKILGGVILSSSSAEGTRYADPVIKFKMTMPPNALTTRPEYKKLFEMYSNPGCNGFTDGTSFVLYALIKELSESVEHAITVKRTKGGYLENHWGAKPSVIQASGQVGLFLSSVGLTPFQVEDPDGHSETVLYWDPTATTIMTNKKSVKASSSNTFNQSLEKLMNQGANLLGNQVGGTAGSLLSSLNTSGFLGKNQNAPSTPTVDSSQAASVGTSIAIRNFRLLLNLFKHNGLIFDSIPNISMHPSTFTAPEYYTKSDGSQGVIPSLIGSSKEPNPITLLNMRKTSLIAPGNVLAALPIEMWVKNTKYTGYFQNFNYSISEDSPYTAFYDFTFIAKVTERTATFFTNGTGGRKSFSQIQNSSSSSTSSASSS